MIVEHAAKCRALLDPQFIEEWRSEQIKRVLAANLDYSTAILGRQDRILFEKLRISFPELDIRWKTGIPIPVIDRQYIQQYIPDITLYDPQSHIWIDIEIDEPWFTDHNDRRPSHSAGQDDERNDCFLDRNWIVLRFAEIQVNEHPLSCVKEVARVLDTFRLNSSLAANFSEIPDLPAVMQWTEEEALNMKRSASV